MFRRLVILRTHESTDSTVQCTARSSGEPPYRPPGVATLSPGLTVGLNATRTIISCKVDVAIAIRRVCERQGVASIRVGKLSLPRTSSEQGDSRNRPIGAAGKMLTFLLYKHRDRGTFFLCVFNVW